MNYVLKQYDTPLLKFSATTDTSDPEIEILWHDESKKIYCRWTWKNRLRACGGGCSGGRFPKTALTSTICWQSAD